METGKASTGGVTLEELAKYLPMAHEIGERKFEKSPKIGRRKRRQGDGNAVYTLTPEGQSYGYRLVTAVDGGKETLVTFYSTRSAKETKKADQRNIVCTGHRLFQVILYTSFSEFQVRYADRSHRGKNLRRVFRR